MTYLRHTRSAFAVRMMTGQASSASNFCFARDFTEIDELTNIGVTALRFGCLNDNTLISIDENECIYNSVKIKNI